MTRELYFSTRSFVFGCYGLVKHLMVPVRRGNSVETLLTNSRPWWFIWMGKQPCLNISSYKNCETVVAFLSLTLFRRGLTNPYSGEIGKITFPVDLPKSLNLLAETLRLSGLPCKFFKFIVILVIRWWHWYKLYWCQQNFTKIRLFLFEACQHREFIKIHNHITNFVWN